MNYIVTYNGFYLNNTFLFTDIDEAKMWATSLKALRHVTDIRVRALK